MKSIYIAVPCPFSATDTACSSSLLQNIRHLDKCGHVVQLEYLIGNPYVPVARNRLVKKFLDSQLEVLVFVDYDLGFDHDAIEKLVRIDRDVVAGSYRTKGESEHYPTQLRLHDDKTPFVDVEAGLLEAQAAMTGLMSIKREVFTKLDGTGKIRVTPSEKLHYYFDTGFLFENDPEWYGEDIAFCKRWRAIGGQIWIVPNINFTHNGRKEFLCNYDDYLANNAEKYLAEKNKGDSECRS